MLKEYQKKRDFAKTKEPSGKSSKPKISKPKKTGVDLDAAGELAFMIHKHRATNLHYDLRLELDGVLKSWAVPKGPSTDPSVKRLAMMVEDHPYEYKDFEGVIPEGEYGGGPTLIWDSGTYIPKDGGSDRESDQENIRKKLQKGHLSFTLFGEKLRGTYALVHIPDPKKDNVWLLSKQPDEYANLEIPNSDISVVSGKTIEELAGETKTTEPNWDLIRSGKKGKMPKNVKPMLATLVDKPFDDPEWIFEIKWDGYRTIAEIEGGKTSLYSRNGISFDASFVEIAEELKGYPDAVFDGEAVIYDQDGKPNFGLLQNYQTERKGLLVYHVFDILYYEGYVLSELPLTVRREILDSVLQKTRHIQFSDHMEGLGRDLFHAAKERNLEGIIGKRSQSRYGFGKRSTDWVKIKNILTQEAIVCGYTEPRGSRKGFGALVLGVYDTGELRYVGHTGGGFDDAALTKMKKLLDERTVPDCPFRTVPKTNEKPTWLKPELVCEVKFSEWTRDGLLRQPIFLGLRQDKQAKEVTKESEKHSQEVLRHDQNRHDQNRHDQKTQANKDKTSDRVTFSHLDKIYFPEDGITKGDLIEYYRSVSDFILPYLIDRPQTLVRHPNGIHGDSFYQKNIKKEDLPSWVCTQEVYSESDDKVINYAVICKTIDSLLYLVNLGCIDLHPWSSRVDSLEYPDYVIFDFDPEDIDFAEVVRAAKVTHEVLDSIGVPSYCKTSGATGIHILVPTGAQYDYEQVTAFAKLINTVVHSRLPETTSLERLPKNRQKRVYLDFLQNRRGQTIASVYSVRPRIGAPVSTPLEWEELDFNLRPERFTVKNILTRLQKKGDLLKGIFDKSFDMEESLKKLQKII